MPRLASPACLALLAIALVLAPVLTAQERPRIGLVLSGGGARGMAHVGVLKVLEELRIPIDCIAGTSMGAVIGGFYAYGLSPAEMEQILRRDGLTRDWQYLLDDTPDRRHLPYRRRQDDLDFLVDFDLGLARDGLRLPKGLSQGQNLDLELRFLGIEAHRLRSFDDLAIPFRAVATDILTGRPAVLSRGNLPAAMRASVSVPGAFAPQPFEGRDLIDGMVVNNLPVDQVRAMGADVVLAIDIGSPLLAAEQIASLLGVTEQIIAILTQQNVDASIAALGDNDVLIRPDLESFTATDFDAAAPLIALGERAARAAADRLRPLGVSADEYQEFLRRQRRQPALPPRIERIVIDNDSGLADRYLLARMRTKAGDVLDQEQLRADLEHVFGLGEFERVTFELLPLGRGSAEVRIITRRKSWGPNYVNFGLQINDDFDGNTNYQFGMQLTLRELNSYGGEWRLQTAIGERRVFSTELYQPFEPTGTFFVAPRLLGTKFPIRSFEDGKLAAQIDAQGGGAGFDVGARLGRVGELRLGIERVFAEGDTELSALNIPDVDLNDGRLFANLAIDNLDAPLFSRSGQFFVTEWSFGRTDLGADADYQTARIRGGQAFGNEDFGGILFARFETAIEGSFPPTSPASLGGLFALSGFERGQLGGDHVAFLELAAYYQLNENTPTFNVPVYVALTLEAGDATDRRSQLFADPILASSVSIGLDSFFGPILLGYGFAEGGQDAFYFTVGFTL